MCETVDEGDEVGEVYGGLYPFGDGKGVVHRQEGGEEDGFGDEDSFAYRFLFALREGDWDDIEVGHLPSQLEV